MANTSAALPVQTAPVAAELGTGAGSSAVGKSAAPLGQSRAASGFHQLLASQSGKEDQSQLSKQPADANDQLGAIIALLASLGIVQQPPQAADLSAPAGKPMLAGFLAASQGKLTVQGFQAVLAIQGLSGLQLSQNQAAVSVTAQQPAVLPQESIGTLKDLTQNDFRILQQLLAEISASGSASGMNDSNAGVFQALIQQLSMQDPSGQLSGQAVAAIKNLLDISKRNTSATGLQDAPTASIHSALQQPQSVAQNPASSVQLKQSAPAVRTQLSAWQHQVKVQSDGTELGADAQRQNVTVQDNLSITGVTQPSVGVSFGNQLAPDATVENLRIPAAELPQQIQSLLVKNASLQEQGGSRVFRITLVPEGMGEIKVMVSGDAAQNQISVQFLTDRAQTQDLLNSSLPALRSGLEALGVHLHKVEVDFGSSSSQMGNMGNAGFFSQNSSSNPQGFSGGSQRGPAENLQEAKAARDEWAMMEELAGAETSAQINLTA